MTNQPNDPDVQYDEDELPGDPEPQSDAPAEPDSDEAH
jgi:hypothetical protein